MEFAKRAEAAVGAARNDFGITLDYGPDSVQKVEELLSRESGRYQRGEMSEQDLVRSSMQWGAYIGEVIRRLKPSHWEIDSTIGGDGSFPIVFDEERHETFPIRWCYKRIKNGPEDNVWHKFSLLILQGGANDGAIEFRPSSGP